PVRAALRPGDRIGAAWTPPTAPRPASRHPEGLARAARRGSLVPGERAHGDAQVGHELLEGRMTVRLVCRPQDRGWMDRRQHVRSERRWDEPPAIAADAELRAEQRLRGCGAETHDATRRDECDLAVEPRPARGNLAGVRLLVDAPLAARLPAEVLHHVGDVSVRSLDAGLGQCSLQQLAGGTDEGPSREVLVVSWLLADEHHPGVLLPLAEDGLRRALPEVACAALAGRAPERLERRRSPEPCRWCSPSASHRPC